MGKCYRCGKETASGDLCEKCLEVKVRVEFEKAFYNKLDFGRVPGHEVYRSLEAESCWRGWKECYQMIDEGEDKPHKWIITYEQPRWDADPVRYTEEWTGKLGDWLYEAESDVTLLFAVDVTHEMKEE